MKIGLGERTEKLTERIVRPSFRGLEGMSNSAFQDEWVSPRRISLPSVFLHLRPFASSALRF